MPSHNDSDRILPPTPATETGRTKSRLTESALTLATSTPTPAVKAAKPRRPIGSFTPLGSLMPPTPSSSSATSSRTRSTPRSASAQNVKVEPSSHFKQVMPMRTREGSDASSITAPQPAQRVPASPLTLSTIGTASPSLGVDAQTPLKRRIGEIKDDRDLRFLKSEGVTPIKKMAALSTITSPFLPVNIAAGQKSIMKNGYRQQQQPPLVSDPKGKRKLADIQYTIPAIPARKSTVKIEDGKRIGLGEVNDIVKLEEIDLEKVDKGRQNKEGERELGIGISPRKGKVKWNGRGEPPLSLRLSALTSTESASLTLFYTSLHHALNPSSLGPAQIKRARPPQPPRPIANVTHAEGTPVTAPKPISPLTHIRTAPVRLVLLRPVTGRGHQSHLWHATPLRWPVPVRVNEGLEEGGEYVDYPDEVIVNLAVTNSNTRSVGIDPRVLEERWYMEGNNLGDRKSLSDGAPRDLESTWEVGVWGEWSMMDMSLLSFDPATYAESDEGTVLIRKVLFATRYVLAEKVWNK